ncbi:unnamed protein product [Citrullus colocynthis]|uniref:Uncharacterized protein n=1 Tax=Citrullus colocynthis TaxID=252529 RepID=A0ABP0ZAD2_9ROSI
MTMVDKIVTIQTRKFITNWLLSRLEARAEGKVNCNSSEGEEEQSQEDSRSKENKGLGCSAKAGRKN